MRNLGLSLLLDDEESNWAANPSKTRSSKGREKCPGLYCCIVQDRNVAQHKKSGSATHPPKQYPAYIIIQLQELLETLLLKKF